MNTATTPTIAEIQEIKKETEKRIRDFINSEMATFERETQIYNFGITVAITDFTIEDSEKPFMKSCDVKIEAKI